MSERPPVESAVGGGSTQAQALGREIVAAVAVFVAQPELIGEMLWRWRVYGPLFMPRPGVSQRLDVYGYQLLLLGYGFVWAIVLGVFAWSVVETFRWRRRWLADS